ncbi:MAG: hypothetical protein ACRDXD_07685 [Acidimicrobiia bacterium]
MTVAAGSWQTRGTCEADARLGDLPEVQSRRDAGAVLGRSDGRGLVRRDPEFDEVNFWQPSLVALKALKPGAPFLFKLHRDDRVVGGFFADWTHCPVSIAWDDHGYTFATSTRCQPLAVRTKCVQLTSQPATATSLAAFGTTSGPISHRPSR